MDCLENIIGITQSECECVIEGLDSEDLGADWYKESTSDLYLDELEGIVSLQAVKASTECDKELVNFYYRGRSEAIKALKNDIVIGLTTRFTNAKKAYSGPIGGTAFSGTTQISKTYAGVKYHTYEMKGGTWKISKIYTMMNATANFDIEIYKVDADYYELVKTIPVGSLANKVKENALTDPLNLELGFDYYFLYKPAGFLPRTNSNSCGCGGKEANLKLFMQVAGITGNDIPAINRFSTMQSGNGIALEAVLGCDTQQIVCEAYNTDAAMRLVMAYAVRYKAGELVHEYVLKTNNISRYTMVDREFLWGKRNHFRSEYNDRINWLVQNIDMNLIDCYACKDRRVTKGGILT